MNWYLPLRDGSGAEGNAVVKLTGGSGVPTKVPRRCLSPSPKFSNEAGWE